MSHSTAHTIASQKSEIATLRRQVEVLQEELGEFKNIVDQRSHALEELQEQFDELSVAQQDTSYRVTDEESWAVVREELHRQANHVRTIEAANAKMSSELTTLRQRHANIEVLKEQKRELERKAQAVDELRETVVKLEAELDAARKEREEWYVVTSNTRLILLNL
jgi:mitotic spindle assembly checkpoint protein MAD1